MEKSTQDWLNRHLKHAKTKRPGFASSVEEKRTILTEEFEEVMEALDRGDIDYAMYELREGRGHWGECLSAHAGILFIFIIKSWYNRGCV